ncbi:hypothetical protein [Methylomicrobium lacus]|uniref:hypothetical protein n=1 Tax=Methylomicrobium lacus TaxID=136992 RepID=UPI00045E9C0F|nr:hypothetical protein [Methylomicrobium lacus]
MKDLFTGVLITAPTTAIILLFALSGKNEVLTAQERHYIDQHLAADLFDQEFEAAWGSLKLASNAENRAERIKKLEERKKHFDEMFDQQFATSQTDVLELRAAIQNH